MEALGFKNNLIYRTHLFERNKPVSDDVIAVNFCLTEKEIDAKSSFGTFWNYIWQIRCLCVIN